MDLVDKTMKQGITSIGDCLVVLMQPSCGANSNGHIVETLASYTNKTDKMLPHCLVALLLNSDL